MMKTITYEQFLKIDPYYHDGSEKHALMAAIAARRERWSALDLLALDEGPSDSRLWYVLREELIDAPLLHEFACRCAERALSRIENPDPRSVRVIEVKRSWLRGEATDEELAAAWGAAQDAAWGFAWNGVWNASHAAAWEAARAAARDAAWGAAWESDRAAASDAVRNAAWDDEWNAVWNAERQWQIEELQKMLNEQEG